MPAFRIAPRTMPEIALYYHDKFGFDRGRASRARRGSKKVNAGLAPTGERRLVTAHTHIDKQTFFRYSMAVS